MLQCLWLALLTLGGCTGVHLYDEQKNKTASDIKASYEKIDVAAHYDKQRQALAGIRARESDVVREATLYDIDTGMFELARLSREDFGIGALLMPFHAASLPPIDRAVGAGESRERADGEGRPNAPTRRAKALGLTSRDGLIQAVTTLVNLGLIPQARSADVTAREVEDAKRLVQKVAARARVDCPHVVETPAEEAANAAEVPAEKRATFTALYNELIPECEDALKPAKAAKDWLQGKTPDAGQAAALKTSGEIALAYRRWQDALDDAARIKAGRRTVQSELQRLSKEIEEPEGTFDAEAIKARAEQLRKLLSAAGKGAEELGIDLGGTAGQLQAVDALLQAAVSGEVPADEDSRSAEFTKALIVSASLQDIGADVGALVDALSTPEGRISLLLESERLRVKRDYLRERLALVERKAEAARARLTALLLEARYYHDIASFLIKRQVPLERTIPAVLGGSDANAKFGLYGALEAYAGAIGTARLRADEAFYERIDIAQRETILANEFAARQWDGLIRVPVERVAAYHAAGVKPETIAQLGIMLGQLGLLGFVAVKEAD